MDIYQLQNFWFCLCEASKHKCLAINLVAHVIDVEPHVSVVIKHVSRFVVVWLAIYDHESLLLHSPQNITENRSAENDKIANLCLWSWSLRLILRYVLYHLDLIFILMIDIILTDFHPKECSCKGKLYLR